MKLEEITEILIEFRNKRNWKKYHTPKNLAVSIAVEVGELLELFQWKGDLEINELLKDEEFKRCVGEEISDVLIYLLTLAHECGIDIEKALQDKIKRNEEKYPV